MIWCYLFILIFGSLAAFASQVKRKDGGTYFRPIAFVISYLILFIFTCFTNSGDDYESFYLIIDTISWENPIYATSEIGFNYLCLIIKSIVISPDIVLFILKWLTLTILFGALYLSRNFISIGFSYLVYVLLYWLPSLFVIPLFLSSALCTFAFVYYLTKGKRLLPIVLVILAAQLHMAAYFSAAFYIYLFFLRKKQNYFLNHILLTTGALIGSSMITLIVQSLAVSFDNFFYDVYEVSAGGTGLKIIIEYFVLLIIIFSIRKNNKNHYFNELVFTFFVFSLSIAIVNFSINTASRMFFTIMSFYIIVLSNYCFKRRNKSDLATLLIYTLCLINGILTYRNYTGGPIVYVDYHFFNPF